MNDNDEFIKMCDEAMNNIDSYSKIMKNEIKKIKKLHLMEIKKLNKAKKNAHKPSGILIPKPIPPKLAKFIGKTSNALESRSSVGTLVYKEFIARNLYYENDKRVLRADKTIQELFNVTNDVNKSTSPKDKNGLNLFNLQTFIKKVYDDYYDELNERELKQSLN